MVQGGATDIGDSEELIENIVKYISGKEDLLYQFPLQGKQMDKDGRKAIMK